MAYKIVKEDCINCAACEDECPVEAISEVDDARFINPDICTNCDACKQVCPADCILSPDEQG